MTSQSHTFVEQTSDGPQPKGSLTSLGQDLLAWWNQLPLVTRALWDLLEFCRAHKVKLFGKGFGGEVGGSGVSIKV